MRLPLILVIVALVALVACESEADIPNEALRTQTVEELRSACTGEIRLYDTGTFFDEPEGAMEAALAELTELGATTMGQLSRSSDEAEFALVDERYVVALATIQRSDAGWAVGKLTIC
jgi:hypothetical protein